jgi:hypothetical protein
MATRSLGEEIMGKRKSKFRTTRNPNRKPKPGEHRKRRKGESWEDYQQRQYANKLRDLAKCKARAKRKKTMSSGPRYATSELYPIHQHPDRSISGGLPSSFLPDAVSL